jgi:hypothetical protein
MLCTVASFATPKPDPSTYTIAVHVSAARYGSDALTQILSVAINGRHYEIQGPTSSAKMYSRPNGLLDPGDYKAKLTEDTHKSAFESLQVYEILLPDGTDRSFSVILQLE